MAEIAYLGQVTAWGLDELLDLEHQDRRRFVQLTDPAGASEPDDYQEMLG